MANERGREQIQKFLQKTIFGNSPFLNTSFKTLRVEDRERGREEKTIHSIVVYIFPLKPL